MVRGKGQGVRLARVVRAKVGKFGGKGKGYGVRVVRVARGKVVVRGQG